MTGGAIKKQIRQAVRSGATSTSFPIGTSILQIDAIVRRMYAGDAMRRVTSIHMQAGALPNYNIVYKE